MGMSHLALATQYVGKRDVSLCEVKFSTRLLYRLMGYRTFASVDAAAAALGRLDGVLIATPTPSHAPLLRWAIQHKVPCFVEKPLTLNTAVDAELKQLAESAGSSIQVGFVMRYVASFQRLRELVRTGALGPWRGYTASMRGNVITKPPSPDSWQGDFRRGGGCLNEYGPHIIDLCRFIFGSVQEVTDVHMERVHCRNADDRIRIQWTHDNGVAGSVDVDWCDTTKRKSVMEISVQFEHADVRVDNSAVELAWHDDCTLSSSERAAADVAVHPKNVGFYLRGEEFSLELEEFLSACKGRRFSVDDTLPNDITARLHDGSEVDRLIEEVARKAGLK